MKQTKHAARSRRKSRVRVKISGTGVRPRLSVFRSNKSLYVQFIDDVKRQTLLGVSDAKEGLTEKIKVKRAHELGRILAQKAQKLRILEIVFDRGGYRYHGRVQALADGLREGGLKF